MFRFIQVQQRSTEHLMSKPKLQNCCRVTGSKLKKNKKQNKRQVSDEATEEGKQKAEKSHCLSVTTSICLKVKNKNNFQHGPQEVPQLI